MFNARMHTGAEGADSTEFGWAKSVSVSFTPVQTALSSAAAQNVTVLGAKVGDIVTCNPPASGNACFTGNCRVSAADTVSLPFINPTAGNLTHAAGAFNFFLLRVASKA